jgi:PhzF family phenazine biosynthesis protein
MKLSVFQVDSFTTELFSGNPAGVVLDAHGLSEKQMLQIARELHNSETAFLFEGEKGSYDLEVRFFTPLKEVPLCGHATVAAHYVYAKEHGLERARLLQKTRAGILPVEVEPEEGDLRVTMTQGSVEYGEILQGSLKERLLEGLGMEEKDLDSSLPIQIVSTGHSKVLIPLKKKKILDGLAVREDVLIRLSEDLECNGYYTFTFDSGEAGVLVSGRMFAPALGIREDPVTGNANGPLGAYLTRYGRLERKSEGSLFTIKQGEALGRKGYMRVQVYSPEGAPQMVKISGRARLVFRTEIFL